MELDQAEAKPRQPITCREVRLNLEPAPRFRSQLLSFPRKAQNWPPRRREPVYAARGSVWQARLMRARAVPGLPKTTLSHLTQVSFLGTPPTQAHIDLPPTPPQRNTAVGSRLPTAPAPTVHNTKQDSSKNWRKVFSWHMQIRPPALRERPESLSLPALGGGGGNLTPTSSLQPPF